MFSGRGQKQRDLSFYSEEQVRRSLIAAGITIEGEVDTDYLIYCPWHSNYRTPAGEVAKESGHFYCFACSASHTLVELVQEVSGKSYFESLRLINSKGDNSDIVEILNKTLEIRDKFTEFDAELIDRLHDSVYLGGSDYFHSRGINDESIEKFKLGYSLRRHMVTVPVHSPDGVCVGFVGRSVEGKFFKNSKDLPKKHTLFNLHRVKRKEKVFVIESSFEAILLDQVGANAVATLGARVSNEQAELLNRYFNSIILVRDNDDAGKEMAERLTKILGSKLLVTTAPSGAKDVGDLSRDQLITFVNKFDNQLEYILED